MPSINKTDIQPFSYCYWKKSWLTILMILLGSFSWAQRDLSSFPNYDLVPKAVRLKAQPGKFNITNQLRITAPTQWKAAADLLASSWHLPATSVILKNTSKVNKHQPAIQFIQVSAARLSKIILDSIGVAHQNDLNLHIAEAYSLKVSDKTIQIQAVDRAGALHGLFTLLQLEKLQWQSNQLPAVSIQDYPRFAYRGLMLDVSRNFFPPAYIKKLLDLMALYKLNNFHWHLTDGGGWRLEIKKYPLLTSKAAFRPEGTQTAWSKAGRKYSKEGEPGSYGGYYTQQQVRDIVAYASARGINIIPEIEFPGHAEELLHAYPFLSATGSARGVHELNVCSEATYTFMENVLTEVMQLFPSTYIHIGGDEASKKSWKDCQDCKVLMKKENIKTLAGLQSYGIRRLEQFLASHGRKLLGWDEITQGGLAPGAAVMVWRNPHTAIEVARQGHYAIEAPSKYLYLDHYQSDPMSEPEAIGGYIPLSKVYHFNPLPKDSLTERQKPFMLGVQANLFTEWVPTEKHADYMLFPRALALAEIGWTPHKSQHYQDFLKRIQGQYLLLQRAFVHYHRPDPTVLHDEYIDKQKRQMMVTLSSEYNRPAIYYSTDGSDPLTHGILYTAPFPIKGHALVKAAVLDSTVRNIKIDSFTVDYHRAIGKTVYYNSPYAKSYPGAGNSTLTDGITGTLTYSDDRWQGFLGKQMDVTVDMNLPTDLHSLDIRFMQLTGPGVYMPIQVAVFLSNDNKNFQPAGIIKTTTPTTQTRLRFENYHFNLQGNKARYIRVVAPVFRGFLFTDEIKIY